MNVKIGDFGLALEAQYQNNNHKETKKNDEDGLGTPMYRAPEQTASGNNTTDRVYIIIYYYFHLFIY